MPLVTAARGDLQKKERARSRQRKKDRLIDRERESGGRKNKSESEGTSRSNSWDKQRLAVKHADAKNRLVEGKNVIDERTKEEKQETEKEWRRQRY